MLGISLVVLFLGLACGESAFAIPAFARKYGLPCSACHEAWPKLNNFGQRFKDTGYQLGNDRDSPIYQQPGYWPIAMRITPQWHAERDSSEEVDQSASGVRPVSVQGFDLSGLDILTAGTLSKNISFLLVPSADNTGAFHFESAWVRFDNLLKTPWLNFKLGKFELDNVISEKRILTLSNNGGFYQAYHYQPGVDPVANAGTQGPPGETGVRTSDFGLGDNQLGIELMGHSASSYSRYSVAVLSNTDGNVNLPSSSAYETFLAGSQAFNAGSLGLQRVGAFSYLGRLPTNTLTETSDGVTTPIPGGGYGEKGYSRTGVYGLFYLKKLDLAPMFTHGNESAYLTLGIPSTSTLPPGIRSPSWNGRMLEAHYTFSPQFILVGRYEDIRNTKQVFTASQHNFGDLDAVTIASRWYPFINNRAGFALHTEYSKVHSIGTSAIGTNDTTRSAFIGMDFAF